MITFSIILIIAVAALMAVQALDVECSRPNAPQRVKGLTARRPVYVPANSVTN